MDSMFVSDHKHDSTKALHVGSSIDVSDAFCEPIAMSSAYNFASAQDAWEKFSGQKEGNVYTRFTNPTVRAFEQRVAALEEAEDAVAFASGMGAITALCMAFLGQNANIVCSRDVFGTTLSAFRNYISRFGVETRFCDLTSTAEWEQAIDHNTRLVLLETPSNPTLKIGNIEIISHIAHNAGALVAVDNTMLTPIFQKPHHFGADLVVHSAGKYMDGQGRALAGVVTGSQTLMKELRGVLRTLGISCSPFNAWLLLKSLETLEIRMQRAEATATELAMWLESLPSIQKVYYTGLSTHSQFQLANHQQTGHGGLLSFVVQGSQAEAWRLVDSLQLISRCTNIGDTRTMVTHPATTTHCRMTPEERDTAGIAAGLVRLSVGMENVQDLKKDLSHALSLAYTK